MPHDSEPAPRVVVIGASSSVGRAVLDAVVESGASVLATYRDSALGEVADRVTTSSVDVADLASMRSFADDALAGFGPVDALIVLSAILPGKSLADYSFDEIDQVMSINATGVAKLIKLALPHLADDSHIVLMSSISAERGSYDPMYAASKGALLSLMKSLASWLAPRTRVNALTPALIEDTRMFHDMAPERREYHRDNTPVKRLLQPRDLARIIVDLLSPHWRHLNGAVIRLNGGSYV